MRSVFLCLPLALSLLLGQRAQAATFTATNTNDTNGSCAVGNCTLRQAINSANALAGADTITFAAGVNGTISLGGRLPNFTTDLTISVPVANSITVDGNNLYQIAYIKTGTTTISGLNFSRGETDSYGGAIRNDVTLTLSDCTFTNGHSESYGGAIACLRNAFTSITRCTFTGNQSDAYGGAIENFGTASISNSTFSGNSASDGGAIDNTGPLTLSNCTIFGNSADYGGGIENTRPLDMTNCIVAGNVVTSGHPDIEGAVTSGDYNLVQNTSGATLSGTHNITGVSPNLGVLQNNGGRTQTLAPQTGSPVIDAGSGGGSDQRGLARPFDTPGVTNVANGADIGAVEVGASVAVQSGPSFVVTNATDADDGTCTASDCSLREAVNAINFAPGPSFISFDPTAFAAAQSIAIGSDFPSVSSSVTITGAAAGVTIDSSNKSSGFQVVSGTVNLFDLTFTGSNSTFGVQNSSPGATLTVRGCTFTGNFNGLQLVAGSTSVQNSTFSGNTRGILATTNFSLSNSTISGNSTGLYLNGAVVIPTVSNSIVAGNNTNVSNNNGSSVTDGGHNLLGVTAAQAGLSSAGLQFNGGPTKTIALVSGPAVDGGDPAFNTGALPFDQRGAGYSRKSGTAIDIGAFEAQVPTALTLTYNTILENQPIGTYIGSFQSTDPDPHETFTYSFATGAGDDDNGSFSINSSGSLRSAAIFNLATKGSYSILVTTTDAAGLSLTKQFTITVLENSPPSVTITSPVQNQKLLLTAFDGSLINGTASDNSGVTAVKIRLTRKRNGVNQYWNGTTFITSPSSTYVDATVTTAGNPSVTWNFNNVPPANKLDAGLYQVEAYALDAATNRSATVTRSFTLTVDSVKPTISISTPTVNQIININNFGAGSVTGVAGDDTGVVSVKLKLQRKRGSVTTYWNGSAFTSTVTLVDATVTTVGGTSVTWSLDSAIPANQLDSGAYTVYATAYDAAGNFLTTPSRGFFLNGTAVAPVSAARSSSAKGS